MKISFYCTSTRRHLWHNFPFKLCSWLFEEVVFTAKWISNTSPFPTKNEGWKILSNDPKLGAFISGPVATGKVSVCHYWQTNKVCPLAVWDNEIDTAEVEELPITLATLFCRQDALKGQIQCKGLVLAQKLTLPRNIDDRLSKARFSEWMN